MIALTTPITLTGSLQSTPVTITQVRIAGIAGEPSREATRHHRVRPRGPLCLLARMDCGDPIMSNSRRLTAVPSHLPPPPAPETLKGIGEGIYEIQRQQRRDTDKLDEIGREMADVSATVTVHGREIRKMRETLEEHHERLVDLERLPRATPSTSIPPLAKLGTESPSGSWIIKKEDVEKWTLESKKAEKAERWDTLMGGAWKVVLAAVISVVIFGLTLLGGALLQQAHEQNPLPQLGHP